MKPAPRGPLILTKRLSRIAAIWLGLTFFVAAGLDALGLHECPHHGLVTAHDARGEAPGSQPELATSGHSEHAGHGGHFGQDGYAGRHGAGSGVDPTPAGHADHGSHDGPCTCVGTCQMGGNALGGDKSDRTDVRFTPALEHVDRLDDRYVTRLPSAPAFLLPLATAPPGLDADPN